MAPALFRKLIRHRRSLRADAQAKASEMPCRDAQCRDTAQKRGGQRKRKICKQSFSFLRPGHSATQFVAQKTHSYLAGSVGRISQGTAVFCVRNAAISGFVRSMPSPSTSRHFCAATRRRRRCSTTISTSAGSSRRRRSGTSARNGDANVSHARVRRSASSVARRAGADDL